MSSLIHAVGLKTLTDPDLWERIEGFNINEGAPGLTFAARLARENGWTVPFAQRVLDEYRRFVYLAMTAGHRVTPSEHVDQAWHLHMLYTDSYWKRLCGVGGVLPRALEHTPTRGGNSEDSKFEDWYARTKESYEREFGEAPARDIWPDSETRFGHDLAWRRVNLADSWVIPKRAGRIAGGMILAFIAMGAIVIGLVVSPSVPVNAKAIAVIVMAVLVVGGVCVVAASALTARGAGRRAGLGGTTASGGGGGGEGFWWFGGGAGGGSDHDHRDSHDSGADGTADGASGSDGGGGGSSGGGDGGGGGGGCGGGGCGGGGGGCGS